MKTFFLLFFSLSALATELPTAGDLKITKVYPAWSNYNQFNEVKEWGEIKSKTIQIKSNNSFTSDQNPSLTGDSAFSITSGGLSEDCKIGKQISSSTYCEIRISFNSTDKVNGNYSATLTWQGFSIPLTTTVNYGNPVLKVLDTNNREITGVNFNTFYQGDGSSQYRTVFLKDINKSTTTLPEINLTTGSYTISHSCTLALINSTGCNVQLTFNPAGKNEGTYIGEINLGGILLPITSLIEPAANKGTTPNFVLSTSNGELISQINFGTMARTGSTKTLIFNLRDTNKVINSSLSYSLVNSSSNFTSIFSSCSATVLKSSGCIIRVVFNPVGVLGTYSGHLVSTGNFSYDLTADIAEINPYSKTSNYVFYDQQTGEILTNANFGNYQPGSSGVIQKFVNLIDLNSSHYPSNTGLTVSVNGSFSLIINGCSASTTKLNDGTGCNYRLGFNSAQSSNHFVGSFNTNLLNLALPLEAIVWGNTCTPLATQDCSFPNGLGSQACNLAGSSWGTCQIASCNADYHEESGACVNNLRTCTVDNGQGLQQWLGGFWDTNCALTSCNTGFHNENNVCISNVRICSANNGYGEQYYENETWGECVLTACNPSFHLTTNGCESNQRSCLPMPMFVTSGQQNWEEGLNNWGSCQIGSCTQGYKVMNNNCVPDLCPEGQYFDGTSCQIDTNILVAEVATCPLNQVFNGTECVILDPNGQTVYDGNYCKTSTGFILTNFFVENVNGVNVCTPRVCDLNIETKKQVIYKKVTDNTILEEDFYYVEPSNKEGYEKVGICQRTCTNGGKEFSACEIISCKESNGYLYNSINKSCDKFDAVYNYAPYWSRGTKANVEYYTISNSTNSIFEYVFKGQNGIGCNSISDNGTTLNVDANPNNLICNHNYTTQGDLNSLRSIIEGQYNPVAISENFVTTTTVTNGVRYSKKLLNWQHFPAPEGNPYYRPYTQFMVKSNTLENEKVKNLVCNLGYKNFNNLCKKDDQCTENFSVSLESSSFNYESYFSFNKKCQTKVYENGFSRKEYVIQSAQCASGYHPSPNFSQQPNSDFICLSDQGTCQYTTQYSGEVTGCCYYDPEKGEGTKNYNAQTGQYFGNCKLSCKEGFHAGQNLEDGLVNSCIANVQINVPIPNGVGNKLWKTDNTGYEYSSYVCNNNAHDSNNIFDGFVSGCKLNIQECSISNGQGNKNWQGASTGYSNCSLTDCNNGFHEELGVCVSNIRDCTLPANATRAEEEYANVSWGTCQIKECTSNYHIENNQCVSNTQSCTIANGEGSKTWNGTSYGTCSPVSCNANFEIANNQCLANCGSTEHRNPSTFICEPNVVNCSSEITNSLTATKTWNGNSYGTCTLIDCQGNYHKGDNVHDNLPNSCVDNVNICTDQEELSQGLTNNNISQSKKTWNGSGYDSCKVTACSNNLTHAPFVFNGKNECRSKISSYICSSQDLAYEGITPQVSFEATEYTKDYNNNSWQSCKLKSCKKCTNGSLDCLETSLEFQNGSHEIFINGVTNCEANLQVDNDFTTDFLKCSKVWNKKEIPFKKFNCLQNTVVCEGDKEYDQGVYPQVCRPKDCMNSNVRKSSEDCNDPQLAYVPKDSGLNLDETKFLFYKLTHPQAKCYDGSPGGFYYRKGIGSGVDRWIIHLEGGGACGRVTNDPNDPNYSFNSCDYIINNLIISNESINVLEGTTNQQIIVSSYAEPDDSIKNIIDNNFPPKFHPEITTVVKKESSFTNSPIGFLSFKKTTNKDFYSWNHVVIKYCSQDMWTGNGGNHNGYKILTETINTLKQSPSLLKAPLNDLDNAKNIILSGRSAGGIGLIYYGQNLKSVIDPNKDISYLIDSAIVNDYKGSANTSMVDVLNVNSSSLGLWQSIKGSVNNLLVPEEPTFIAKDSLNFGDPENSSSFAQKVFIVQDIFDYEFMNYNARKFYQFNNPLGLITQTFKTTYVCEYNTSGNFNSNYQDIFNYVQADRLNSPYNFIVDKYSGVLTNRGRHAIVDSSDWNNLIVNNFPVRHWFNQWYFNSESVHEVAKEGPYVVFPNNLQDFTGYVNELCPATSLETMPYYLKRVNVDSIE